MQEVLDAIAKQLPSKDPEAIRRRYELLEEDIKNIESGRAPLPNYADGGYGAGSSGGGKKGGKSGAGGKKEQQNERKKGIPWTEEEHRMFLLGLEKFGKGDWRSISRNFVVSRTPTQVASHAQKYFIRLNSMNKRDKRRASIHDITSVQGGDVPVTGRPNPNAASAPHGKPVVGYPSQGPGLMPMPSSSPYIQHPSLQSGQQFV